MTVEVQWYCDRTFFSTEEHYNVSQLAIVCSGADIKFERSSRWEIARVICRDEADANRIWFALWNTYRINATTVLR